MVGMVLAALRYPPLKSAGTMAVQVAVGGNQLVESPVVRLTVHLLGVKKRLNSSGKARKAGIRPLHQR